jgi:hypothetical protein
MKRILLFLSSILVLGIVCCVLWRTANASAKENSNLIEAKKNTVGEVKTVSKASTHLTKETTDESSQSTLNSIPKNVQPILYGNDWLLDEKEIRKIFPAIDHAVPMTKKDISYCHAMGSDLKNKLKGAMNKYYGNVNTINGRADSAEYKITAVRELDGYILLWIAEPNIRDGGRSLIYSRTKNRIVGDFWDGGIRG